MDKQSPKGKMKGWKKELLIALCIILLLILLAVIFGYVYIHHLLNQLNRVEPGKESTISPSQAIDMMLTDPDLVPIDPDTDETFVHIDDLTFPTDPPLPSIPTETRPSPMQPPEPEIYGDHLVNILLVGQDRREGQSRQRSDSMILLSANKSTGTITLTSFMRDCYVRIPGYKPNKLNAAYQFGGMKLLCNTLELNFGVQVDGVVEVDFSGFQNVIDLLGGVEIYLTSDEAWYIEAGNLQNGGVQTLKEGVNRLNGKQALAYARIRELDSDYRRAERQRKVLTAVMEAYKNQPLTELLGILYEILPMVTTNMSNDQIIGYATELFPMFTDLHVETLRIPVDGTFKQGNVEVRDGFKNWFQYNIDFAANKDILMEIFKKQE